MPHPRMTAEDAEDIAERLYDTKIKPLLEPSFKGQFLVIDVESGEYEVDPDEMAAMERARAKNPNGIRFLKRVGFAAAHSIGSRRIVEAK